MEYSDGREIVLEEAGRKRKQPTWRCCERSSALLAVWLSVRRDEMVWFGRADQDCRTCTWLLGNRYKFD